MRRGRVKIAAMMWIAAPRASKIAIAVVMGALPPVASLADEAPYTGFEVSSFQNSWTPSPPSNQFSSTEFRPRGRSMVEASPSSGRDEESGENLETASAWQRLREFQAHNRIRLLTLWQNSASSLSIQAGRKGTPTLQWTLHALHRGEGARGLFDRLFSVTIKGAGDGLRGRRSPAAMPTLRSFESAATPGTQN